jgi:hypothetical protein
MVATTSGSLNSLYPALVITLSNCAPYFKNLNITSSARLIQLLTSFANPMFLLSDEGNPRLLFFMYVTPPSAPFPYPHYNLGLRFSTPSFSINELTMQTRPMLSSVHTRHLRTWELLRSFQVYVRSVERKNCVELVAN